MKINYSDEKLEQLLSDIELHVIDFLSQSTNSLMFPIKPDMWADYDIPFEEDGKLFIYKWEPITKEKSIFGISYKKIKFECKNIELKDAVIDHIVKGENYCVEKRIFMFFSDLYNRISQIKKSNCLILDDNEIDYLNLFYAYLNKVKS